jgi:hypothetical protein
MTPEGKVKNKIKTLLDGLGAYYLMPVTHGMGTSGHPDFIVNLLGLFIGIEAKATKNDMPTPLQAQRLRQIVSCGGLSFVVDADNIDLFYEALRTLYDQRLIMTDSHRAEIARQEFVSLYRHNAITPPCL